MRSQDFDNRTLLVAGRPQRILLDKYGMTPTFITGRGIDPYGMDEMYLIEGEGFFGDLWDGAKKVVNVGKQIYEKVKPVVETGVKVYDTYKKLSGKGLAQDYFQNLSLEPEYTGGSAQAYFEKIHANQPRSHSHAYLSKQVVKSLPFRV